MSFQNISVKKKDIQFYRGDTFRLIFENISEFDSGQTVKFSVRKTPDSSLVISKDIMTSDSEGNDWANLIIAVNLADGDTQLVAEGVYRYDLQVIRGGIVKTEYYGNFQIIGDITRVGQGVIDNITEASIYENLASQDNALGASLIGVATSIWSSLATTVQGALQWLLNNKLTIPSSFTANRLVKLSATSPGTTQTGLTVTNDDDLTGARFVTGSATPTDNSHLTRKDYVDSQISGSLAGFQETSEKNQANGYAGLDSGGFINSGQIIETQVVEAYLDGLPGSVGDVLEKGSGGYSFEAPGAADVEAYLDGLGGSANDLFRKTGSGYAFFRSGLVNFGVSSISDDGQILISDFVISPGEYLLFNNSGAGNGANTFVRFMFDGVTPTILESSSDYILSDTDGFLCIYESSGDIYLKNRLGASVSITFHGRI
jgi:hypothetical protein